MSLGKRHSIALGAGDSVTLPGGRFFKLIQAAADVTVEFKDANGQPMGEFIGMRAGFKLDIEPSDLWKGARLTGFGSVKITSATAQTVAAIVSRQPIDYDNVSTEVTITSGTGNPSTADVSLVASATTLIKAAGTRKKILITNLSAGAEIIRLGDVNTGAARGIELAPGMTAELDTSGAVYGYNPSAATAQSVGILELT